MAISNKQRLIKTINLQIELLAPHENLTEDQLRGKIADWCSGNNYPRKFHRMQIFQLQSLTRAIEHRDYNN
ncbi:MAG TPA: hypothetical protein V6D27_01010 [Vampirovibrionales bacterium]